MKKQMILTSLVAIAVAAGFAAMAVAKDKKDKDQKVTASEIPTAVLNTINDRGTNVEVKKLEKCDEDGKPTYEAEVVVAGKKSEITIAANGKLLSEEEDIALDAAPEAVRATINAQVGDGKVLEIVKVTEDGEVEYEAKVEKGGKKLELVITAKGKLDETKEIKGEDKEDKEDKDGDKK